MSNAVLPLLFVFAAGAPDPHGARVIKFAGGSTSIETKAGVDHVVVRDAKGNVTSESSCDPGTFDGYFSLFEKLRDAVLRSDQDAVVKLVAYPLRVNGRKPVVFRNADSLAKSYAKVFTADIQAKIRKAEPAAVFCRDGRAMLGDGIGWATGAGIAILNP